MSDPKLDAAAAAADLKAGPRPVKSVVDAVAALSDLKVDMATAAVAYADYVAAVKDAEMPVVTLPFADYMAAGATCLCSPLVPVEKCPIHAYIRAHHDWEKNCGRNQGVFYVDYVGNSQYPCTCPPKLPSELP